MDKKMEANTEIYDCPKFIVFFPIDTPVEFIERKLLVWREMVGKNYFLCKHHHLLRFSVCN
jgi:hypothetical protein